MGWLHDTRPATKADFVQRVLRDNFPVTSGTWQLLDHAVRGSNLWVLAKPARHAPVIVLFLLRRARGCWGYKDMDESMGPFYYDCPLKFLEQAPEPSSSNRDHLGSGRSWREHVRDYHAARQLQRQQKPRVGDVVRLTDERFPGFEGTYQVTADLGRKGLLLNEYLRLSARQIKWAERLPQSSVTA